MSLSGLDADVRSKTADIKISDLDSGDPRLPFGRHPLAGGGMSLTSMVTDFYYVRFSEQITFYFGLQCRLRSLCICCWRS